MTRKQRCLLFTLAAFTLLIGLQSLATADPRKVCGDAQCQEAERQKILRDEQLKTQKTVVPKGSSTGPTVPPKPAQGSTHK
jgi:hypothetical protein